MDLAIQGFVPSQFPPEWVAPFTEFRDLSWWFGIDCGPIFVVCMLPRVHQCLQSPNHPQCVICQPWHKLGSEFHTKSMIDLRNVIHRRMRYRGTLKVKLVGACLLCSDWHTQKWTMGFHNYVTKKIKPSLHWWRRIQCNHINGHHPGDLTQTNKYSMEVNL